MSYREGDLRCGLLLGCCGGASRWCSRLSSCNWAGHVVLRIKDVLLTNYNAGRGKSWWCSFKVTDVDVMCCSQVYDARRIHSSGGQTSFVPATLLRFA